jgi:Predicted membrane protein
VPARTRLPRIAAGILLLGGALATGPAASAALAVPGDVHDFEFESMHVEFTLTRDADGTSRLRTVETLVALFPDFDQNRGIVRDIPSLERFGELDEGGFGRIDHGVDVVGVRDEHGDPVPFDEWTWTDYTGTEFVSLALGTDDYVHGRTTYVIEWVARDVVLPFADTGADEFYWDVNGTGWRQRFGSVTADIRLGEGLADHLTGAADCVSGSFGADTPCALERTADGFRLDAGELSAGENATFSIGFEPGTFRPPVPLERSWPFTVLPWVLLGVLVLATALVVAFRSTIWTHHPGRGIVIPEYEGPDELGVMSAASLVGNRKAALPAQLVRLATEGVVRLIEHPEASAERRFELELVDPDRAEGPDADAVRRIFPKQRREGDRVVLDRRDRKLGDRIASLQSLAVGRLSGSGCLRQGPRSPLRRLIFWPAFAVLLAAIGLVVYCAVRDVGSVLLTWQLIVAIVGALVVMGFSGRPVRRTAKGAEVYDRLLGLRAYLRLAEADRLRVLQSPRGAVRERIDPSDPAAVVRLYERLLPWAVVWGVERDWAQVLADHYDESVPPSDFLQVGSSLSGIATLGRTYAASSFATTPTVSSSSSGSGGGSFSGGSSGGGFSGGGGGGGGGGGR